MKHSIKQLWLAMRPWSFPVSVAPVVLTAAFLKASGIDISYGMTLWTLWGIVLFHAAGNLFSDYFDFRKGVDTDPAVGSATITGGLLTARETMIFACIMLALACVCGIGLMCAVGWPLLIFGLLGASLVVAYPWLKFHALGDLDILLTFGVLPTLGTAFVLTGRLDWTSLWITPTFATITMAVLHANNTRDTVRDSHAHIHTFAMLIGLRASQWVYYVEEWLPLLWVIICVLTAHLHWSMILFVVPAAVLALRNTRVMKGASHGDNIDTLDQFTAQHQLINTVCLLVGMLLSLLW
ncbi:MAG: prenyltransferase [Paludibacteraceae bacterium]|nr:prenyltransferase [Paludibacteraceae bacterium]